MPNGEALPKARTDELVTKEVAEDMLVYDLKRHKAHCLNQTAALVWKYCDGKKSVTEIATLIEKDLNTAVDDASVWFAVERLGKAHLLEERVIPPGESPRLSRRDVMRGLGLGATLAVPVVMSIIAPTAQAANTCVGTMCTAPSGCPCSNCCSGTTPTSTCLQSGLSSGAMCTLDCQCASVDCMSNNKCK